MKGILFMLIALVVALALYFKVIAPKLDKVGNGGFSQPKIG